MDRDGYIELTIAEDAMLVLGDFFPALGGGRMLSPDYLATVLESQNVVHGVRSGELEEIMLEVNTSRHARRGVPVARGTEPVSMRPPFFRVLQKTAEVAGDFTHDAGQIDYKQVTRLPVVRRGQVIARRVPLQEGVPGTNVHGEEVPFGTIPVDTVVPGKNTLQRDDVVVAGIGGQLQTRDGQFFVEDRLEIGGNVDYQTGSIEFPGDVILKGEVKDGFHVWAGGAIIAAGTVDVSEIYCRKDFSARGGLVGRGRALLRCGGRVQARFVGNCHVESKSSVFVKQYVYQAHIGSLDRLALGPRGRIIGGVTTAAQGVRCYTLGNSAHVPTLVRVGLNFIAERKLDISSRRHQIVTLRLQKLLERTPENPTDRQLNVLHQLEEERQKLSAQMGDLAGELDRYEDADVVVDGVVYPGVQIQICRAVMVVEEELKKVRFSLDKVVGRVVVSSLTAGAPPS
ncbi:DUF342 domain-containing protein [Alkalispirochaeta alkalica]|uniref:DUF342 domain-containing protein n=1 Tax=Alkalispirochaeta alkalica TaxID=46356 RepID=UPI00037914DC|nr:FapA family protein [Alkalispirochaeta alkalica]